tara:strand:+ start:230 stop:823 length:594 start_codon:yes stop_codon:yes gene_type:complete
MGKYKLIKEDTMKNLIEFLDEVQFDAATDGGTEEMHKVNFCNWAINELINSPEARIKDVTDSKPKKPQKKSRDDYVDETFMDWNLPDMSDEDYEKLVDTFDAFLRGWEEEYYKNNPKKKPEQERPFKPHLEDVAEYMSLEDIKEMLLDDPELSDHERFELYYEEHLRVQKEKKKAKDMLRKEYNKFKKERKKQLKKK